MHSKRRGTNFKFKFNSQVLKQEQFLGQYGKIIKIVVNKNKVYTPNGPTGP